MMTLRAGMSRCPYFYKFRYINALRFRKKRSKNRTRIARVTRIRTDKKIRENPFDLCHPCPFPQQRRLAACAPGEARRGGGWGKVRGRRRTSSKSSLFRYYCSYTFYSSEMLLVPCYDSINSSKYSSRSNQAVVKLYFFAAFYKR